MRWVSNRILLAETIPVILQNVFVYTQRMIIASVRGGYFFVKIVSTRLRTVALINIASEYWIGDSMEGGLRTMLLTASFSKLQPVFCLAEAGLIIKDVVNGLLPSAIYLTIKAILVFTAAVYLTSITASIKNPSGEAGLLSQRKCATNLLNYHFLIN